MSRRKYTFKDRAEAEKNYRAESHRALLAEWVLSAVLRGRNVDVGVSDVGTKDETVVGYVVTGSRCIVYAFAYERNDGPHCIRGIWDSSDDTLPNIIASLLRYKDTYEFGSMLEKAKRESYQSEVASFA